ncbi:hypothetical protein ES703_119314 [subsurface metagenome]
MGGVKGPDTRPAGEREVIYNGLGRNFKKPIFPPWRSGFDLPISHYCNSRWSPIGYNSRLRPYLLQTMDLLAGYPLCKFLSKPAAYLGNFLVLFSDALYPGETLRGFFISHHCLYRL